MLIASPSLLVMMQAAQTRGGSPDLTPLFMWIGIAVVILVIAGVGLMFLRRRVLGQNDQQAEAGLMEDLRAMRDRGEISEEEYRSIRATMVERARQSVSNDDAPAKHERSV